MENRNTKINSLILQNENKKIDEISLLEMEKDNIKKQMKITSAYKDKNIKTEPSEIKWKRNKEKIIEEFNKDCTFQPSPLKINKNITKSKIEQNKDTTRENSDKVYHKNKNVHERL